MHRRKNHRTHFHFSGHPYSSRKSFVPHIRGQQRTRTVIKSVIFHLARRQRKPQRAAIVQRNQPRAMRISIAVVVFSRNQRTIDISLRKRPEFPPWIIYWPNGELWWCVFSMLIVFEYGSSWLEFMHTQSRTIIREYYSALPKGYQINGRLMHFNTKSCWIPTA